MPCLRSGWSFWALRCSSMPLPNYYSRPSPAQRRKRSPEMDTANHRRRKFVNHLMQVLTCVCALFVVVPLCLVFYHVLKSGLGSLNWAFFTQLPKPVGESGGGMANAIVGTFELLALASVIGVPIGIFGGIFLSEYGSLRLNWWIRFGADVLNGVPSIIWG